MLRRWMLAACGAALVGTAALAATRGVSDNEIVIGTYTDLSGVTAVWGVNNSNAIRMAFDEQNSKGGVNGRKIRYIVEDNQYQVPRSVQAANKLINRDGVFLMIANGGTPMNNATLPDQIEKGVPNMFPLTAARSMYEPYHTLKFGQFASYYDQMRAGVKVFVGQRGKKRPCAMWQDTDFGRDNMAGVNDQLKASGVTLAAETTHKPTDTDFSASISKLRDANCDVIFMATIVRDANQIIAAARKIGWTVDMMGASASYDSAVAEVPGGANEGFYTMTPVLFAYPDDSRPAVQAFAKEYKAKFGRDPNFAAEVGYSAAQVVLIGLERAGRDLTMNSFLEGMETVKNFQDIFGAPPVTFGPQVRHGSTQSYLTVVHNGRWEPVTKQPIGY